MPYSICDDKNPEDMTKDAPDHSADAVRYEQTAANQWYHNYRSKVINGGAHPLTWAGEDKVGKYVGGVRVGSSRIHQWRQKSTNIKKPMPTG